MQPISKMQEEQMRNTFDRACFLLHEEKYSEATVKTDDDILGKVVIVPDIMTTTFLHRLENEFPYIFYAQSFDGFVVE